MKVWHELSWHELSWHELSWHELSRHELSRHELSRHELSWSATCAECSLHSLCCLHSRLYTHVASYRWSSPRTHPHTQRHTHSVSWHNSWAPSYTRTMLLLMIHEILPAVLPWHLLVFHIRVCMCILSAHTLKKLCWVVCTCVLCVAFVYVAIVSCLCECVHANDQYTPFPGV